MLVQMQTSLVSIPNPVNQACLSPFDQNIFLSEWNNNYLLQVCPASPKSLLTQVKGTCVEAVTINEVARPQEVFFDQRCHLVVGKPLP